jgi:hypothetical protein
MSDASYDYICQVVKEFEENCVTMAKEIIRLRFELSQLGMRCDELVHEVEQWQTDRNVLQGRVDELENISKNIDWNLNEQLWLSKEQIKKSIAKETFNSSNIERIFKYRVLQDWLTMHNQIETLQSWREKVINLYPDLERME